MQLSPNGIALGFHTSDHSSIGITLLSMRIRKNIMFEALAQCRLPKDMLDQYLITGFTDFFRKIRTEPLPRPRQENCVELAFFAACIRCWFLICICCAVGLLTRIFMNPGFGRIVATTFFVEPVFMFLTWKLVLDSEERTFIKSKFLRRIQRFFL